MKAVLSLKHQPAAISRYNTPLMSFNAVDPTQSATVFASAGTGKTWQLVTRLLRLLLTGNEPGSILAVTFTRKAAAEMQQRLLQRLSIWATCDNSELDQGLREIGCTANDSLRKQARGLYEDVLLDCHPVRATTFHSFCHDLLARFPLEAGVPPGFELIEQTVEQQQLAWDTLMTAAARDSDGSLATALEFLFDTCRGVPGTRTALDNLLNHRSDWWAYTEDREEPLDWAIERLETAFETDAGADEAAIYNSFYKDSTRNDLAEYATLLGCHAASPTNQKNALNIQAELATDRPATDSYDRIRAVLLTATDTLRVLKTSKKVIAELGGDKAGRLLELHQQLGDAVLQTLGSLRRLASLRLNQAWLTAGSQYLEFFQAIKMQRRQLDFTDLEWRAYRLLNAGDNALTVQYKLDQRIDHLLIDEFQDTNPTQWRLVYPLLEEFASTAHDNPRTVFMVGDAKQSIYSFRRANPELQQTASHWLQAHLNSHQVTLDTSYRSAPAIIDMVNTIFADEDLRRQLPEFQTHATHRQSLWGRIEILPLAQAPEAEVEPLEGLRNPLEQPLLLPLTAAQIEARQIATRIQELVDCHWEVGEGDEAHRLNYGDIKILLRQRTHAAKIEQALREAGIPFRGTARGALLGRLEIQDMRALLTVLGTPQDNLALAQVLRSPLFAASDEDLITLAQQKQGCWYERLLKTAPTQTADQPLARAALLLERWQAIGMTLPLHDLLDQIYHEGNVIARYRAAARPWQRPQMLANLRRLLDLALEIDSGRYPSLSRFLTRLNELESAGNEAPSEPTPMAGQDIVEILTVHQSKGLEAPVIFFCNLAARPQDDKAWSAMVDWPANAERPRRFLLQPRSAAMDPVSQKARDAWKMRQQTEAANLLYVALTRAKQMLVLSASETAANSRQENRYQQLKRLLEPMGKTGDDGSWLYQQGEIPVSATASHIDSQAVIKSHPGLGKPLSLPEPFVEIAPSQIHADASDTISGEAIDADGQPRGVAIHRFLELLIGPGDWQDKALLYQVAADLDLEPEDPALTSWLDEAKSTIRQFPELFTGDYIEALNESPVLYTLNNQQVYGLIDRLLIFPTRICIIDYKTHRLESPEKASELARFYRPQLEYYAAGLQKIYPGHKIEAMLLNPLACLVDHEYLAVQAGV